MMVSRHARRPRSEAFRIAFLGLLLAVVSSCATPTPRSEAPVDSPRRAVSSSDDAPQAASAGAKEEHTESLSTTEIARRASSFAVFVRSGAAYGAGVLMDDAGHVVTCDHVLLDPEGVEVRFEGSPRAIEARVVDRDPDLDLALIALEEAPPDSATPASRSGFEDVTTLERGDPLYAMGSPRKMSFSFHRGMVSFLGRPFDRVLFLQTDLPMNPGSSGGPILDQRGKVVGLASFILRDGQGLSFALPIDYAFRRFSQLRGEKHGERIAAFEAWITDHRGEDSEGSTAPAAAMSR